LGVRAGAGRCKRCVGLGRRPCAAMDKVGVPQADWISEWMDGYCGKAPALK
jgi:hypothetical protein